MYQKSRISLFYLSMLDCAIHRLANGMFPMPSPWYVWTFSLSFYFSQCDWALQKEGMFYTAFDFDQDISQWDVRNVKNMHSMFQGTYYFNQPIGRWNVENVKKMSFMFADTVNFHQNIGDWNVGNVQNMSHMFFRASQFNHGGIAKWDVQNVENMKSMFEGAIQFNQDIGDWNVANVKSMAYMFQDAIHFRQNLCDWKSRMKHATTSTCTKMFSGTNCSHRSTVHCVKEVGGFCESC
mmetsp:Transcript_2802/g.6278  ORF Transcript_2802/g.6278 Transcript_2802/m.6278 type:complete len:237 (+) Transcript_2802:417-1127(+)